MQIVLQILFKIVMSLATEAVFRALIANALEQIKNHTETKIDDSIVDPIIEALRQK